MKHQLVLLALLIGCSSNPKYGNKEHQHIQKDYIVRDASSNYRPGWIEDANGWAKKIIRIPQRIYIFHLRHLLTVIKAWHVT